VIGHMIGWQLCMDVGSYPILYVEEAPSRLTFGQIKKVLSYNQAQDYSSRIGPKPEAESVGSFYV
jgi:hypothetical protein